MIKILNNKQMRFILLITVIISLFFSYAIKDNFLPLYIGNLSSTPVRYFFITISIIVENIIYQTLTNSVIISRHGSREKHLKEQVLIEIISITIIFVLFHSIAYIFSFPQSLKYLTFIIITFINFILIYIFISYIIKIINLFVRVHSISCVIFLFLFASIDFIIDYVNFFFFNESLFNLNTIYKIFYSYPHGNCYLLFILITNILCLHLLNFFIKRKDLLIKNEEEN